MELKLVREDFTDQSTIGRLSVDGRSVCYILEPPKERAAGKHGPVCIPAGRYRILLTYSQRFKKQTLELMDVPGRTGIRIHSGNLPKDTEGCLLPGYTKGPNFVEGSMRARDEINTFVERALNNKDVVYVEISG